MFLLGIVLACGEEKTDTGLTEDNSSETDTEAESESDTSTSEDSDTDTQSTEDDSDAETDTPDPAEDPQWFEAGTYTGTYSCEDGIAGFSEDPSIEVESTGGSSGVKIFGRSLPMEWTCSVADATDNTETVWNVNCTGTDDSYFYNAKVHSEGFKLEMEFLFSAPGGDTICSAVFE